MTRSKITFLAIFFVILARPVFAEESAPETPRDALPKKQEALPKMPTSVTSYDLFVERGNTAGAVGLAVTVSGVAESGTASLGLGLDVSVLHFYQTPSDFHRSNYYPVHGFIYGCRIMTLNPCFEFGLDLGDAVTSAIPRMLGLTDENACCDTYAALGVSGRPIKRVRVFTYLKAMLINYAYVYSESKKFVPLMLGLRIGYE